MNLNLYGIKTKEGKLFNPQYFKLGISIQA
jgi:hypothetical protein